MSDEVPSNGNAAHSDRWMESTLKVVKESLQGLRFGQVLLIVHEGAVVQVERTERKRISRTGETP